MNTAFPSSVLIAVFSLVGLAWLIAQPVQAASLNYTLYITEKDRTINIPLASATYTRTFWVEGFTTVSGGLPEIGGVTLTASEGDSLNLTVFNQTTESHDFQIKGTTVPKVTIAANTSKTVSFLAPVAGDYIYYDPSVDTQTTGENRAAGMAGVLVVYPMGQSPGAPGTIWSGGPSYNYDFTWVLSDMDKRWNAADKSNSAAPKPYTATYAFINGDFGTHSLKNPKTSPVPYVGDVIAIRLVNTGMISHPIHFHGYHGEVRRVNNVAQTRVLEKDVVDVPPLTTIDLIFHIDQKGIYIVHDHTGMMVTQDGIYAEGMIAEFDTCKKYGALIPGDPYCPTHTIGAPGGWGGWGGGGW